jgi:hypothetical protein
MMRPRKPRLTPMLGMWSSMKWNPDEFSWTFVLESVTVTSFLASLSYEAVPI